MTASLFWPEADTLCVCQAKNMRIEVSVLRTVLYPTVLGVLTPMMLKTQVFWDVTPCREGRNDQLFAKS